MSPAKLSPRVVPVPGRGTEDLLVGDDGAAYTGTEDGIVWRVEDEGRHVERLVDTGGRPMGLEWLPDGRLLVCDAQRGLLAVDLDRREVRVLTDLVHGRRMRMCNNAAVAADGTVWFTDSSLVHGVDRWEAEMAEDTRTGRLLRRTPEGVVSVVLDGLRFANGVALARDESFVAVAETAGRCVVRHWLSGPRAGLTDDLVRDLPGYPDNIALGSDGLVWVTIASPTEPVLEAVVRGPFLLRTLVWRVPERLRPRPRRTLRVQAYDEAGRLVHDLDLDPESFRMATGVREHHGKVWLSSLVEPALAVVELSPSGD